MKLVRRSLAVCLAVLFMAPAASAQSNVIGKSALDKAVQERVATDQADRDAIQSLLRRAEVREVAGKAGLSLDKASAAVSTLAGSELAPAGRAGAPGQQRSRRWRVDGRDLDDDDHHHPAARSSHRRDC